jgi:type I restriction enzyme, S subunit
MDDARWIPAGYKRTEVGVIPEDWEMKRLGDIANVVTGSTPPTKVTENYGEEFLFVSPADLGKHKYVVKTEKRLSQKGFSISRRFPKGSILFTCIGSTIGKCGIAGEELTSNQQINAVYPSSDFSNEYLYYALELLSPQIKAKASEQAVPIINKTQFSATSVPLPPLPEQRAIADVLSDVDALIAALERLIAKKRAIKQGAMQQLLTGQTRLPGFSGPWKKKKLSDIFAVTAGGDFDPSRSSAVQDEVHRYPIYSNALSKNGLHGFCSYNDHRSGAITVTARGTLGVANFRDHDFTAIGRVLVLDPQKPVDGRFFSEFINDRITFAIESTGVPQLTAPQISKYELSVPPLLEQRAIADVLSDMDAEIAALEARRDKTRAIKQGMMQQLLTGRIRLV